MKLTIQKIRPTVGSVLDATRYLDETERQLVRQEIEFNAFRRTIPDISVSLSDLSDTFTTLFSGFKRTHLYEVCVYDDTGRRRFFGYIDPDSLTFYLRDRYAKFNAYFCLKRFWDKAKTTKLFFPHWGTFSTTITLAEFFRYEADQTDISDSHTTFLGIDTGDFATETIAGHVSGVRGCFYNLNRDTTWDEIMQAFSLWYNAEFYIDPETRILKMVHREDVLNDRQVDIDSRLCDDQEIVVSALQRDRVDYVKAVGWYKLQAPTFVKYTQIDYNPWLYYGLDAGTHYYCVTYEENGIETLITDVLGVTIPLVDASLYRYTVTLRIPVGPGGAAVARLYRADATDVTGEFRAVWAATVSTETSVTDSLARVFQSQMPMRPENVAKTVEAWYGFNEDTGAWTETLDLDGGLATPEGTVFNIIPSLRFLDYANHAVEYPPDPFVTFYFFGNQFSTAIEKYRTRWADLFRTRRRVSCKVTGIDWEVGDSVVSAKNFFPNDLTPDKRLVVRKAVCDLMANETDLELVTV